MKYLSVLVLGLAFIPNITFATTLTQPQVNAIVTVLEAFGVSPSVIATVETELAPQPVSVAQVQPTTVTQPVVNTTPVLGASTTTVIVNPCASSLSVKPQSTSQEKVGGAYYFTISAKDSCFSPFTSWQIDTPNPTYSWGRSIWPISADSNGMHVWGVGYVPLVAGTQEITVRVNSTYASTTVQAE